MSYRWLNRDWAVEPEAYDAGTALFLRGAARVEAIADACLTVRVGPDEPRAVTLRADGSADCPCGEATEAAPCRHMIAALLQTQADGSQQRMLQAREAWRGQRLMELLSRSLPGNDTLRLLPVLRVWPDGRVGLGLSLGQERLYAVKHIPELLRCFSQGRVLELSPRYRYDPTEMRFGKQDEHLLTTLASYLLESEAPEADAEGDLPPEEDDASGAPVHFEGRFVLLRGAFLHGVLRELEKLPFGLLVGEEKHRQNGIATEDLPLIFTVSLENSRLLMTASGAETVCALGDDARFVLCGDRVVRLHTAQARLMPLLAENAGAFALPGDDPQATLSELLPGLSAIGTVAAEGTLKARLVDAPFSARVYLDLLGGDVVARVEFRYGDCTLDPFARIGTGGAARGDGAGEAASGDAASGVDGSGANGLDASGLGANGSGASGSDASSLGASGSDASDSGASGLGANGSGASGSDASGLGISGSGISGLSASGSGEAVLSASGSGISGSGASGLHAAVSDGGATGRAASADAPLLLRDGRKESALINFLSDAGFTVRGGSILLRRAKDILAFCTQGVAELEKLCEVYVSQAFEKIKPRRFAGTASFRMQGDGLVFSLLENGEPVADLGTILEAVQKRQQYVRLKSGEFLDLRDLSALSPVAQELLDASAYDRRGAPEESDRELHFGAYRAVYLVSMLRMAGGKAEAAPEVENALSSLQEGAKDDEGYIPARLRKKLADYQLRGAGWLLGLYKAGMGGVLADEMGLGKTIQVIALLSAARRKDGAQPTLIVTPTSLIYHWLAELKRFDDALTVRMIGGMREERRQSIETVAAEPDVDVVLTSYPLLRRDAPLYQQFDFRFIVLDEAQYVKNAQSLGATAVKGLRAKARFALTGTPMENHTGELWSIFDFVLPGYLGTQASFLRRYGGGERASELQERIRPFLMRRLKKDALADLPGKREVCLYAAMTKEQEAVYRQLLGTLRTHVDAALKDGALSRARMQVLSILLKLRQVCCHPKLFLPDYEGESGKLELLVQTVRNAVENKHRLLVFSQFVGMLQIIRKRLSREGFKTLYLDGSTKPQERQDLCDRFNGGEGQVFLISLKAGGVGLNLTGADLVIHYDPWWNPAAEDQATDRAHRIGQTRDVDVIRLITQDTIEEKVVGLSKRKRAIFDRVVLAGESALGDMSEEDIRALFL